MWEFKSTPNPSRRDRQPWATVGNTGEFGLRSPGFRVKVCEATSVCRGSERGPLGRDSTSHQEQPHLLGMCPGGRRTP